MAPAPLVTPDDVEELDPFEVAAVAPRVSAAIRRFAGWHIAPVLTETLTVDGPGGRLLTLPTMRVVDLTAMTVDGEAVLVDDYEWSARGQVRYASLFPATWRAVTVTLEHGYPLEDVEDVVAAAVAYTRRLIRNPDRLRSETVAGYSGAWDTVAGVGLDTAELAILAPYRLNASPW